MELCKKCGQNNWQNETSCSHCGEPLAGTGEAPVVAAQRLADRRQALQDNPFDPRTEISADAIHIASRVVTHLWIIFVLLPFVLGLLWLVVVKA